MIWAQLEGFRNICKLSTFSHEDLNQKISPKISVYMPLIKSVIPMHGLR